MGRESEMLERKITIRQCYVYGLLTSLLLFLALSVTAQEPLRAHSWEVYIERDTPTMGIDTLIFQDILTGEVTSAQVAGERYTQFDDRILYFDHANQSVMTVDSQGQIIPHSVIQLGDARRLDWVVSADQRLIAWTLTYDVADGMRTETFVASPDGANIREVFTEDPRSDGLRAFPISFSADKSALVMDFHPDLISGFAPYTQYAGLFRLSLSDGSISPLPDDGTPCFCSAALYAGQLMRLSVTSDLSGFDVLVFDLTSERAMTIPATRLTNFTQAGDILIAPDGSRAVYALSEIDDFGTESQTIQTVFMLVDLQSLIQTRLTEPVTRYIHPVKWTEDNTAVIFTSPERNGTWKINLADGILTKVAEATYLGVIIE